MSVWDPLVYPSAISFLQKWKTEVSKTRVCLAVMERHLSALIHSCGSFTSHIFGTNVYVCRARKSTIDCHGRDLQEVLLGRMQ